MSIYITSDTHFYHTNVIKYCNRPFTDSEEMNKFMIKQWNSVVSNNDTIIHLGDFGFGNKEQITEICSQLNGNKILIKGNHDLRKGDGFWLDCGFQTVYKRRQVFLNEIIPDYNNNIILSHYPVSVEPNQLNIHGHIHNSPLDTTLFKKENHICVCVELLDNYKPVNLEKLILDWRDKK